MQRLHRHYINNSEIACVTTSTCSHAGPWFTKGRRPYGFRSVPGLMSVRNRRFKPAVSLPFFRRSHSDNPGEPFFRVWRPAAMGFDPQKSRPQ